MSPGLAGEDPGESIPLFPGGTLVEVQGDLPFHLQHVPRRMGRKRCVQSIKIRRAKIAFVYVPGDQNGALALCRRAEKNARARSIAIASLEITAGQFPLIRHDPLSTRSIIVYANNRSKSARVCC